MTAPALSLALLLLASAANAQPPPADPERDERARNHYAAGNSYYQNGAYEDAVREFRLAYELSQRPALLFNLANAYERLGRVEEAADHLSRFLAAVPETPDRTTLEERL